MMIIMGKVNEIKLNDNGDQTLGFKVGTKENQIWAYITVYFRGKAPFELGDEVEVVFKKKDESKQLELNVDELESNIARISEETKQ